LRMTATSLRVLISINALKKTCQSFTLPLLIILLILISHYIVCDHAIPNKASLLTYFLLTISE